jgi:hypothetical protein
VRPGALASAAHTGGILEGKALWIDREFHASDAARVPSCYDAQGLPDGFGLYRYREARSFGVDLDRDLTIRITSFFLPSTYSGPY